MSEKIAKNIVKDLMPVYKAKDDVITEHLNSAKDFESEINGFEVIKSLLDYSPLKKDENEDA